jgi:2-polyprenyl-6-methoxyphenol hydroxylase-like FAD-dependent oxidoreductase
VVVGAGPTGAFLALALARARWAVTLVEATGQGTPRPYRGEGLMPSGLAALEAMGLWPLPEGVVHRPLQGWAVVLDGQPFFAAPEPLRGDRGCWLVDQDSLLHHLRSRCLQEPGTRILEGCAVRGLLRSEPEGRVEGVRLADGTEVRADLVVGCDGRHSPVRQQADLPLQQEPLGEEVLWFRLAGAPVAPLARWLGGRFLTVVGQGLSFALFAEAAGEALRLGWIAERGLARPVDPAAWRQLWSTLLPGDATPLMAQLPDAAIDGPQRFPVQVGWAPRWHAPGLLLLGDAAHPMSPVRAQGINMALRDALVAARLLAPIVQTATGAKALHAAIDAQLPRIAGLRLREIRLMQSLQAREASLGARLRQQGWLRSVLAATAPWSGPLARQRWIQQQHRLRQGAAGALVLPE